MSKFRPILTSCIYVIPDIHARYTELKLILNRILPLRRTSGIKDKLIFLGDYIDRGHQTPQVIDTLIEIRKKYNNEQIIFLRGNHEDLLLRVMGRLPNFDDPMLLSPYALWFKNGGSSTILSYAKLAGLDINDAAVLSQDRAISFIKKEHIDFLVQETVLYHEHENYLFVHGGFDYTVPLSQQNEHTLLWDRNLYQMAQEYRFMSLDLPWNQTVVTGHCQTGPFISEKFMMLDCSADKKLLLVELNSLTGFYARYGNKKLLKEKLV